MILLFQSYRKRKIAILLAQGERQEAIRELNEYLKTFINDNEAWLELSNLYLQEIDHARAAHCLEELILSNVGFHFLQHAYLYKVSCTV